jgi:hypothetical protein
MMFSAGDDIRPKAVIPEEGSVWNCSSRAPAAHAIRQGGTVYYSDDLQILVKWDMAARRASAPAPTSTATSSSRELRSGLGPDRDLPMTTP